MLHPVWSACYHQHARCDARKARGDNHGNVGFRRLAHIASRVRAGHSSYTLELLSRIGLPSPRLSLLLLFLLCYYLDMNRFLFGRALVQVPALAEFRVAESRPRHRPP